LQKLINFPYGSLPFTVNMLMTLCLCWLCSTGGAAVSISGHSFSTDPEVRKPFTNHYILLKSCSKLCLNTDVAYNEMTGLSSIYLEDSVCLEAGYS